MENFQLINHIQTAVAVIDKNMIVVDSNDAFKEKNKQKNLNVVATKCFDAAYKFNEPCSNKANGICPVTESFKTKKSSSTIHHFWIDDHAVVEKITTTPIIEDNGEVNYVIEEFLDISKLLGLNKGIISICSYCRKIHDSDGQWLAFETYLEKHTGANFSHGVCEECNKTLLDEFKGEI